MTDLLDEYSFCQRVFYKAKIATAAHRTAPTKKTKRLRHKHNPNTQSHLLFRFLLVFLSAFAGEMLIKITIMQKQLRIITSSRVAVCPFSSGFFSPPSILPPVIFSRHSRRLPVAFRSVGYVAYHLGPVWHLFIYSSGRRQLSALPF